MGEKVIVCEVGPRDGLQMAKAIMPTAVKQRWIRALFDAGLTQIEVGSFVPPKLIPQMADTGQIVEDACTIPGLLVVALAPNLRGAQAAYAAGAHKIEVPVSVSEGHSRSNTNRGTAEQVAEVGRMAAWLRGARPRRVILEAACATAFGCSIDGVVPFGKVVETAEGLVAAGADVIALADTVGYGNPGQVRELVPMVRKSVGDKLEKLHLHDTCGLGLANALAGIEVGIRDFDSALAGLGGCPFAPGASGNIVTEDLVFMLESMGFETGVDLDLLLRARAILHEGVPGEPMYGQVSRAGIPRTYKLAA